MTLSRLRAEWAPNVTKDLLAGTVVALALIPEAIAFSIIAGADPKIGLYASFCIAVVTAFAGGRPAMISAATGAIALVMVTLVKDHGVQYLFAATILTGLIQIVAGVAKIGNLMRFVSRSVVTGFVNALAILIFMAQMPELIGRGPIVYVMTAAGLVLIYALPYLTRAAPSPLITIILPTVVSIAFGFDIRTVGDMGVLFGVILSGLCFTHKVTRFFSVQSRREGDGRIYVVTGQIFFATAEAFHAAFDFREPDLGEIVIDLHASHFWDITSINALDRVVLKFRRQGVAVCLVGMNEATRTMVDRLTVHDKDSAALSAGR